VAITASVKKEDVRTINEINLTQDRASHGIKEITWIQKKI